MRNLIAVLAIPLVLVAALVVYLFVTTPTKLGSARLPLTAQQRALLQSVPADAEAFAFVPGAAVVEQKLEANPITRSLFERWQHDQGLPSPWMLGNADLVVWRRSKVTSFGLRLDPVRALIVRGYLMFAGRGDGQQPDFVVNSPSPKPIPPAVIDQLLALADPASEYDGLVVELEGSRNAFPPIARPAVTSVKLNAGSIDLLSRAEGESQGTPPAFRAAFPVGAMLSVAFLEPPRALRDLDRLFGGAIQQVGGSGGVAALYAVNTGTLLPRPKGLLVLDAAKSRGTFSPGALEAIAAIGEVRENGKEILVSADRESVPLYLKDRKAAATWPANAWSVRIDPGRLVPVLEDVSRNTGLRVVAGRVYRSARDLRKWVGELSNASSIEAAMSTTNGREELRVRLVSK